MKTLRFKEGTPTQMWGFHTDLNGLATNKDQFDGFHPQETSTSEEKKMPVNYLPGFGSGSLFVGI